MNHVKNKGKHSKSFLSNNFPTFYCALEVIYICCVE